MAVAFRKCSFSFFHNTKGSLKELNVYDKTIAPDTRAIIYVVKHFEERIIMVGNCMHGNMN
jgi:hypothetical protein